MIQQAKSLLLQFFNLLYIYFFAFKLLTSNLTKEKSREKQLCEAAASWSFSLGISPVINKMFRFLIMKWKKQKPPLSFTCGRQANVNVITGVTHTHGNAGESSASFWLCKHALRKSLTRQLEVKSNVCKKRPLVENECSNRRRKWNV